MGFLFIFRRARIIIGTGWVGSLILGSIPLYWNYWDEENGVCCELTRVVKQLYIIGILMPLYVLLSIVVIIIYWKIHKAAKSHVLRHRNSNPHYQNSEGRKSMQVVTLIVGCFVVAWFPFMTVICIQSFLIDQSEMERLYRILFYVAMSNSCLNPFIYAWKNRDFKHAFVQMLQCKSVNSSQNLDLPPAMKGRVSVISLFGSRIRKLEENSSL